MAPLTPATLRRAEAAARRVPRGPVAPVGLDRTTPSTPRSATAEGFRRSSDRALRGLVAEIARSGRLH